MYMTLASSSSIMASLAVLCIILSRQVFFAASVIPSKVYISMFSSREKQAVLSAINQVNANASLLPNTTLYYVDTTFTESKMMGSAINMSSNNISALIIDSKPKESHDALSAMLNIPLFSIYRMREKKYNNSFQQVNLGLDTYSIMLELINEYSWKNLVVLYDVRWRHQVSYFLSNFLSSSSYLTIDLVLDQSGLINKTSEKKLHFLRNDPAEALVLFCDASYAERIITQVFPLLANRIKRTHRWLIADPIHSLKMVSDSSQIVIGFAPRIYSNTKTASLTTALSTTVTNTKFTTFLTCDAVFAFAYALHDMCVDNAWEYWAAGSTLARFKNGPRLMKYIKQINGIGTTGVLQFDDDGKRKNAVVDVMNLRNGTFVTIGHWSEVPKLTMTSTPTKNQIIVQFVPLNQLNRKIKVALVEDPPFVMIKVNEKTKTTEFEGFSVDLIKAIGNILNFEYEFYLSADGAYGGTNPDGSFAGVIGEVFKGSADMTSMPLTINSERLEYVGFSKPFMFFSMDMVMRKPKAKEFDITGFMTPYTIPVWVMTLVTWLFVSIVLTFVNYYSPYGHRLCDDEQDGDEFSWFNSLWFCLACMLQQGGDCTPRMFSGRVVVGFFWFCIIVWVSTYTANLASVLTTSQGAIQINNLEDVLTREYHAYIVKDTAFVKFLANSDYRMYRLLWERIFSENTLVDTNGEGFIAIRERENSVFIEESAFSDYFIQKEPCDLMPVKDITGSSSYGIALAKDSPYIHNISIAILKMQENGQLQDLKRKWWNDKSLCPIFKKLSSEEIAEGMRIQMQNMAGVYVVLGGGGVIAVIVIFIERSWKKRRDKINAKVRQGWTAVRGTTQVMRIRKKPDDTTFIKTSNVKQMSAVAPQNPVKIPINKSIPENDETDIGETNRACADAISVASSADSRQENSVHLPGTPWFLPTEDNSAKSSTESKQFIGSDAVNNSSRESILRAQNLNRKNSRVSYVEIVSMFGDSSQSDPRKTSSKSATIEESDTGNSNGEDIPKDDPLVPASKNSKKQNSKKVKPNKTKIKASNQK